VTSDAQSGANETEVATDGDVTALRATIESLADSMVRAQMERDNYKKMYELALFELERYRRGLFGKKAESVPLEQLRLAFERLIPPIGNADVDDNDDEPQLQGGTAHPKHNKLKRRRELPDDLPIVRIEAPHDELANDPQYVKIGEDVSEVVEWQRGHFVKVQYVRPKYARRGEPEGGVIAAPVLERPIPKGLAGPGLLAHVLVSKYADHLPLSRLENIFARQGLPFAKSTMCQWIEGCHELAHGIVTAMWKELLACPYVAVDATGVLVQSKERCKRGHFWVALAPGEHVLYRFTPKHDKEAVRSILGTFKGYIQADAAVVFDFLFRDESRVEVACWAHCRRRFFDAIATDAENAIKAISLVARLYRIDRETAELKAALRTKQRALKATPVVQAFFSLMDQLHLTVLPESPIGKAVTYARNQKLALCRFLEDGRLRLDNNPAELALRHQAIGRKNWLFVASENGATWNTTFVSLIVSCKMHRIEPWAYLRDILCLLPSWPNSQLIDLAPKYWKQTAQQPKVAQLLAGNLLRNIGD